MRKVFGTLIILAFVSTPCFAEGFENIAPANPLSPMPIPANTIALPVKKAVLTHNSLHNQYAIAFDRFIQSNVKAAYGDFKILIETMDGSDYGYIQLREWLTLVSLTFLIWRFQKLTTKVCRIFS